MLRSLLSVRPALTALFALTAATAASASQFQIVGRFGTAGATGENPVGALVIAGDGALYGTTYKGGAQGIGTVYRLRGSRDGVSPLNAISAPRPVGPRSHRTLQSAD